MKRDEWFELKARRKPPGEDSRDEFAVFPMATLDRLRQHPDLVVFYMHILAANEQFDEEWTAAFFHSDVETVRAWCFALEDHGMVELVREGAVVQQIFPRLADTDRSQRFADFVEKVRGIDTARCDRAFELLSAVTLSKGAAVAIEALVHGLAQGIVKVEHLLVAFERITSRQATNEKQEDR